MLDLLIETVSKEGNLLLNVGPTARGEFDARAKDRLEGAIAFHLEELYRLLPDEFPDAYLRELYQMFPGEDGDGGDAGQDFNEEEQQ